MVCAPCTSGRAAWRGRKGCGANPETQPGIMRFMLCGDSKRGIPGFSFRRTGIQPVEQATVGYHIEFLSTMKERLAGFASIIRCGLNDMVCMIYSDHIVLFVYIAMWHP